MKSLAAIGTIILVAACLAPSVIQAQICLDFDQFVDGLELTIKGDVISGWWRNWDGSGNSVPIVGVVQDGLPRPCHPGNALERDNPQWPGKAGVACVPEFDCDIGDEVYFILDGTYDTLDMGVTGGGLPPPGACWLDEIRYTILLGPCPFFAPGDGVSSISSAQAGR